MPGSSRFEEIQEKVWKAIVKKGSEDTSQALQSLLNKPIQMTSAIMGFLPISKILFLTGEPDRVVTCARLVFSGDIEGHMFLILPLKSWEECKNLLLKGIEQPAPELEISAFAEMANIACSFFVSTLANMTGLTIHFTPPEVLTEMAAAVFEETLIQLSSETQELLTIETTFFSQDSEIKGFFFFIPFPSSIKVMTQRFLQTTPSSGLDWSGE